MYEIDQLQSNKENNQLWLSISYSLRFTTCIVDNALFLHIYVFLTFLQCCKWNQKEYCINLIEKF